jgi:hypothetical protein
MGAVATSTTGWDMKGSERRIRDGQGPLAADYMGVGLVGTAAAIGGAAAIGAPLAAGAVVGGAMAGTAGMVVGAASALGAASGMAAHAVGKLFEGVAQGMDDEDY